MGARRAIDQTRQLNPVEATAKPHCSGTNQPASQPNQECINARKQKGMTVRPKKRPVCQADNDSTAEHS